MGRFRHFCSQVKPLIVSSHRKPVLSALLPHQTMFVSSPSFKCFLHELLFRAQKGRFAPFQEQCMAANTASGLSCYSLCFSFSCFLLFSATLPMSVLIAYLLGFCHIIQVNHLGPVSFCQYLLTPHVVISFPSPFRLLSILLAVHSCVRYLLDFLW